MIIERGWWDVLVDPRRYRMRVPEWLVGALGRLLPRPDLTFVLETPAVVSLARKQEIPAPEFERQMTRWRRMAAVRQDYQVLDGTLPLDEVHRTARGHVVSFLEQRTAARAGPGWISLPSSRSPRWTIPRGPRRAARAGLAVYQPSTLKSRLSWEAARIGAAIGILRLLPRGEAPTSAVRHALAAHLPPRSTMAVLKANHPGRHVALVVGQGGTAHAVAKIASDEEGRKALRKEAAALRTLGPLLTAPLSAPRILHEGDGLLLMDVVDWRARARPWQLEPEAAFSLGRFFAAGLRDDTGLAHGDFAPWNVLESDHGWVVVDWEAAMEDAPPFYDLFHYLVQASILLGRPRPSAILGALRERRGSIRSLIVAYAQGAELSADDVSGHLLSYLRRSRGQLDPTTSDGRSGLRLREAMERQVGHRT